MAVPGGSTDSGDEPRRDPTAPRPRHRFIAANLLAIHPTPERRAAATERFSAALERALLPHVDIVAPAARRGRLLTAAGRRVVVFDADPAEVKAKRSELTPDTVIEPVLPRGLATTNPAQALPGTVAPSSNLGSGAVLSLTIQGSDGEKVPGAKVTVTFSNLANPAVFFPANGMSSAAGTVELAFDASRWLAEIAVVEPDGRYWTSVTEKPQSGQTIQLQQLPETGPTDWWHRLSNANAYNAGAGQGIKVGVIDTGIGPHPYLDHAVPIGAFLDGVFHPGAEQGRDVRAHGTHVSGIIGARPPVDGGAYCGIAPGAALFMARIFNETGDSNQGDVAHAIDALAHQFGVDIINMSLSGEASAIEQDAIVRAYQEGTVCVCSAGNGFGRPVQYPASYPDSIAVSGLGMVDTAPADTMPAGFVPTQSDRFGSNGIFLASFSNLGPQLLCSAPGNGIISTIPVTQQYPAPYADMSGTSMSAPLTAGALACLLAGDASYLNMERNSARADAAKELLSNVALSVNLDPTYQGKGMARAQG